jgi:osmotically-inducible protein OsmY
MAIQAGTMSGIVTLTGRVSSVAVAREAERLARSIDGVTDVVVRLQITPDPPG